MTEPTVHDDLAAIRRLADQLDPAVPEMSFTTVDFTKAAEDLRRIAAHLDRIVSGGDRPTPPGVT